MRASQELPRLDFIGGTPTVGNPVIVFVHGLMGDGLGSFRNEETKAYWPERVANDPVFAGSSVAVYRYDTTLFERSLDLSQHAQQMGLVFEEKGLFDRELVFVCHSMGGLLVRELLLSNQVAASKNVHMLCFLGTPFGGAQLARPARLLSDNPTIQNLLRSQKDHTWLNQQQARWVKTPLRDIPSFVAYETEDLYGFRVVDETSAGVGANRDIFPIKANHITLCKPTKEGLAHTFLVNSYKKTTPILSNQQIKPWPSNDELMQRVTDAGITPQEILHPSTKLVGTNKDVVLTVNNGVPSRKCLVLCDASMLYREDGNIGSCFGIMVPQRQGRWQPDIFSRFQNPTGWFLVYTRYRDKDGNVQDEYQGLWFFFGELDPYLNISRSVMNDKEYTVSMEPKTPPVEEQN